MPTVENPRIHSTLELELSLLLQTKVTKNNAITRCVFWILTPQKCVGDRVWGA